MYLKIAYLLAGEGSGLIAARLADFLDVSRASASVALRRLASRDLLSLDRRRVIQLTPAGLATARTMVRRQRLFETWLIDTLGLRWAAAFHEACRLEHAISDEVEQRLHQALGYPERCPHGNPIDAEAEPPGRPLDEVHPGFRARVVAIGFPAEFRPDYLDYLQDHGIVPGAEVGVEPAPPRADGATLRIAGASVFLPGEAASSIRIESATA
jgi:DtxR family Mn-dependent transcriptional regulator